MRKYIYKKWQNIYKKGLRRCYYCKRILPLSNKYFGKSNKRGHNGFRFLCKDCKKKQAEIYRKKYPEKTKQYNQKYYKDHPQVVEKYRQKYGNRRLQLRFQIFQRDDFTCQYCGRKSPEATLEIDHRFPKSKGGKNNIDNYITACWECNLGKGDSILKEFS